MTMNPTTVASGTRMLEAITVMEDKKISELPITDSKGLPLGIIDITDVKERFPESTGNDLIFFKPTLKVVA